MFSHCSSISTNGNEFFIGLSDERSILPRLCFTCETPIKFAFFCNRNFVKSKEYCKKAKIHDQTEEDSITSICLIGKLLV